MAEATEIPKLEEKEWGRAFYHLAPRPISYAAMMSRYLEMRFGNPKEVQAGHTSQLIYNDNGTSITFEVNDVGVRAKGIEGKVRIFFHSKNKKSIEEITSEKAWANFDLKKGDLGKRNRFYYF